MNHLNVEVTQYEIARRLTEAERRRQQRGAAPDRRWVRRSNPYR